jgi:predicted RNase H-like nuclease (RuvC/YqgF family)
LNEKLDKLDAKFEQKLDKLDTKFDKLDEKFTRKLDDLGKDVTELKVDVVTVKTKMDGLEIRLNSVEFLSRGVLIGLLVAIGGGLLKLFGFSLPPNN